MFAGFPSTACQGETMILSMTGSYLETLSGFSSETVIDACRALRCKPREFPPTAGDVASECENVEFRKRRDAECVHVRALNLKRLSLPKRESYTPEQLADWNLLINHASPPYYMRVDAKGVELVIPQGYPGAGKQVSYGYLTPREADWVREQRQRKGPPPQTKDRRFRDPADDERFADLDAFARDVIG